MHYIMLLLSAYFYYLMKMKGLLVIIGLYIGVGEVENKKCDDLPKWW